MNLAKRSVALVLAALMVVVSCIVFVSADMPEGAIALDVAGYEHGNKNCVWYAETVTTVGDFTAIFAGSAKDMNYFAIAICNENGIVTYYNDTLGRPDGIKTDVSIPAGSFIVGFNGNLGDTYNAFKAVAEVGKKIEVYGVDVKATAALTEKVDLENAYILVTEAPVEGAIALDVAGYEHGNKNCVWYAEEDTTVGGFTSIFAGSAKDMNYFAIAICDENGVVTYYSNTLGRPDGVKTDVAIPAGSFIVGFNGNLGDTFNAFTAVAEVGKKIEVYGVDVKSTASLTEKVDLENAYILVTDASVEEEVGVKVQPGAYVPLPSENGIALDTAGYIHGNCACIWYAEEDTTVGDFTAKFAGSAKDMNYFALVICDSEGTVTYYNDTLGRPDGIKTDVAIPAGSTVIGVNANLSEQYDALKASCAVGKKVTVYNVLVKNTARVEEATALVGAGFTVTDPVDYSGGDYSFVKVGNAYKVDDNMYYQNYTVTSGENQVTVDAVALEFNPEDGYIPMAFSGYAGTSGVLGTQYNVATKKYGYDTPAIINGAFFSMDSGANPTGTYGTLVGIIISNGKIATAHAGYSDSVVAFDTNGTMSIVKSAIDYKLFFNGNEIPNGLYYINKTGGSKNPNWANNFYYYDTSCGSKCDTFECCPGYEIICEKVNNTDLMVGATLKGKVLEIREDSYGAALADNTYDLSDKFVLFAKAGSSHASKIKELKAGDEISISAKETIESSKEIMENANSVISNVGWLVKDGVDQTQIESHIGTHSVTLMARWTAFGVKADGTYVYFTTDNVQEGEYLTGKTKAVTLRDVAKAMIELGCVNVIRMDGGGSTAMYVKDLEESGNPGYAMVCRDYNRPVGDCILVVKASSVRDADLEAALSDLIVDAEKAYADSPSDSLKDIIDEAKALIKSSAPVSGDVKRMINKLGGALSGKSDLSDLIAKVSSVSYKDYSEEVLEQLRAAYAKAVEVLGDNEATVKDVEDATKELEKWYNLSGEATIVVTKDAPYTATKPNRGDGWDDDGVRLTDGSKANADGGSSKYAGWNNTDKSTPNIVEIVVDLGKAMKFNNFTGYFAGGDWGIEATALRNFTVYVSDDGSDYEKVAESGVLVEKSAGSGNWKNYVMEASSDSVQNARYIKFVIEAFGGNAFVWVDEVEASLAVSPVSGAIYVNGFNNSITAGSASIFTPSLGEVTNTSANLNWSKNVLLEWNEEIGAYVVVEQWNGAGATVIGSTGQTSLKEGQIIIAAHDWETGVTSAQSPAPVIGSAENAQRVKSAKPGDILVLHGIDVATETVGVAAYVEIVAPHVHTPGEWVIVKEADIGVEGLKELYCSECGELIATEVIPALPDYLLGDIDGNGEVGPRDYALLKRHCLGTYELDETEKRAADIDGNGEIGPRDYALLKRHCLGTYNIFAD